MSFGDVLYHESAPDELNCAGPRPYTFHARARVRLETKRRFGTTSQVQASSARPATWGRGQLPVRDVLTGALAALFVAACSSSHAPAASPSDDAGADAQASDPDSVFTPDQWAALQALSPSPLPAPPPDLTNKWADDTAAAALGQKLFYDTSFSGRSSTPTTTAARERLGTVGQTRARRVRGLPHARQPDFQDTRSLQLQSLARRGMGATARALAARRRAGEALLMWDGRARRALQPGLRSARDRRRDEQLAPLHGRAAVREVPRRVRGDLRPDAAARRRDAVPASSARPLTGCQPTNPADPRRRATARSTACPATTPSTTR